MFLWLREKQEAEPSKKQRRRRDWGEKKKEEEGEGRGRGAGREGIKGNSRVYPLAPRSTLAISKHKKR